MYLIDDRTKGASNIVNYNLAVHTHGRQVPGYALIDRETADSALIQRMENRRSSLNKIINILETGQVTASQNYFSTRQMDCVEVLQEHIISLPNVTEETRAREMEDMFTGINFQYQNGHSSTSYFRTRFDSVLPKLASSPLLNLESSELNASTSSDELTSVVIDTGMCMFSRYTLAAESGIPPVPKGIEPTLYELEIIVRLSGTIADIVGRFRGCNTTTIVNIDIPDFQYYWNACSLLQKGLISVDYMQGWMAAMDLRKSQLGDVMTSMIRSAMRDRGLANPNVLIQLNSGAEEAVALFRTKTAAGMVPSVREVITAMASYGPEASKWQQFFGVLPVAKQPLTMDELGKLVYVFKTVKSALTPNIPSDTATNRVRRPAGQSLIVQVNDITDWRVYDKSRTFLRAYSKIQNVCLKYIAIIGIFPLQRIFLTRPGRSSLYEEHTSNKYEYVSQKHCSGPLGRLGVIKQAYGMDVAKQLKDSLDRVFVSEATIQSSRAASLDGCSENDPKD